MRFPLIAFAAAFALSTGGTSTVLVSVTAVDAKEPHLRFTAKDATHMLHFLSGDLVQRPDSTMYLTPARFVLDRRAGDVVFTSTDKRFRIHVAADVPNVLAIVSEAVSVAVRQTGQQIALVGGQSDK